MSILLELLLILILLHIGHRQRNGYCLFNCHHVSIFISHCLDLFLRNSLGLRLLLRNLLHCWHWLLELIATIIWWEACCITTVHQVVSSHQIIDVLSIFNLGFYLLWVWRTLRRLKQVLHVLGRWNLRFDSICVWNPILITRRIILWPVPLWVLRRTTKLVLGAKYDNFSLTILINTTKALTTSKHAAYAYDNDQDDAPYVDACNPNYDGKYYSTNDKCIACIFTFKEFSQPAF